jgi:hypothetical protein
MAAKKPTTRKRTAKKTAKRPATRAAVAKRPSRHNNPAERLAAWLARHIARHARTHRDGVRSRRDAAILRATHAGCQTCGGTGTLFTKDKKTGAFNGSKPCPAKPTAMRVSRRQVRAAARFGPDKRSGLIGWSCPCGKRAKPQYRDAKTATAALREHEKRRHGGHTVGGAWYVQMPEGTPTEPTPEPTAPLTKTTANSGKTDLQWLAQNARISPGAAAKRGLCGKCGGKGATYTVHDGQHITTVCQPCGGTGKATTPAAA